VNKYYFTKRRVSVFAGVQSVYIGYIITRNVADVLKCNT